MKYVIYIFVHIISYVIFLSTFFVYFPILETVHAKRIRYNKLLSTHFCSMYDVYSFKNNVLRYRAS